jgi:hypothetical protein
MRKTVITEPKNKYRMFGEGGRRESSGSEAHVTVNLS